jgi:NDP-sugar pyrophosphorylase family protein
MEAMILAAGLGTRLRPLTERLPKALVPVRGRPLLAHALDRVVAAGATRVVINTHHHAEQIEAWVAANVPSGVEIALSREPDGPYETGGGLLAARRLFSGDGPILLHNVDVLSRVPLEDLCAAHGAGRDRSGRVLATVAVQDRPSTRGLVLDDLGVLGRERDAPDGTRAAERAREPVGPIRRRAVAGVHVVEPAMLERCRRSGAFSLIEWYLDLVRDGFVVQPVDVTAHAWMEVGTPERLAEAEARWE